jgi:hypothetical protein
MLSNLDVFSDAQGPITASAYGTSAVNVGKFAGQGEPVDIAAKVVQAFNNLTNLKITVREADTEGGSYTDVMDTPVVLLASLVIGYEFKLNFVPKVEKPWVKLYYTLTGTAPTTGKITSFLKSGRNDSYKDGLFFKPRNPTGAASTA